jgi:hypothetical protein
MKHVALRAYQLLYHSFTLRFMAFAVSQPVAHDVRVANANSRWIRDGPIVDPPTLRAPECETHGNLTGNLLSLLPRCRGRSSG